MVWALVQLSQREVHNADATVSRVQEVARVAQLAVYDTGSVQTVNCAYTSATVLPGQLWTTPL